MNFSEAINTAKALIEDGTLRNSFDPESRYMNQKRLDQMKALAGYLSVCDRSTDMIDAEEIISAMCYLGDFDLTPRDVVVTATVCGIPVKRNEEYKTTPIGHFHAPRDHVPDSNEHQQHLRTWFGVGVVLPSDIASKLPEVSKPVTWTEKQAEKKKRREEERQRHNAAWRKWFYSED